MWKWLSTVLPIFNNNRQNALGRYSGAIRWASTVSNFIFDYECTASLLLILFCTWSQKISMIKQGLCNNEKIFRLRLKCACSAGLYFFFHTLDFPDHFPLLMKDCKRPHRCRQRLSQRWGWICYDRGLKVQWLYLYLPPLLRWGEWTLSANACVSNIYQAIIYHECNECVEMKSMEILNEIHKIGFVCKNKLSWILNQSLLFLFWFY